MAEIARRNMQIQWGPVIGGAFVALAVMVVLGLFGTAFGLGGATGLSAVWQILTPLVAIFIGSITAVVASSEASYGNAIMVWCLAVVFTAAVLVLSPGIAVNGTGAGLAGLAAILGLVGAVVGGVIGASAGRRLGFQAGRQRGATDSGYRQEPFREERIREETVQPSSEATLRREQEDRTYHH